MRKFEYFEPKTVKETISILQKYGDRAKILAGGTNLVPELRVGRARPDCVVNIKTIEGLGQVREDREGIHLGASVCLAELALVEIPRRRVIAASLVERIPALFRRIVSLMGNPQVRNLATIAGNLAWGSPAADAAPPLLVLDAQVKLQGPAGERSVPLDEFFRGPGESVMKQDEVITEILIPEASLHKKGVAHKFMKRKANTLSVCSAAVSFNKANAKAVKDLRIAVGAVAPVPMRVKKAEALLEGQKVDEQILKEVKRIVSEEINPITDLRSTVWFRKEVTPVLLERCITEALR